MSSLALRRAQTRHPDQWGNDNYAVWEDGSVVGYIFRVDDASEFRVHDQAETWIWGIDVASSPDSPWGRVGSLKEAKTAFQGEYARLLRSQRRESEPTNIPEAAKATKRSTGVKRAPLFTANKLLIAILSAAAAALAIGVWSYWPSRGTLAIGGWRDWPNGAYMGVCLTNNDVSAADRQPYEAAGLAMAKDMVRGNLSDVYSQVSADAKSIVTLSQLAALRQVSGPSMTTLTFLRVTHTYFLQAITGGESTVTVLCPAVAAGTMSSPEDQVFVALKSSAKQAHVIVEGDGDKQSTWNFAFWLVLEDGVWRMRAVHFGPAVMFGKSASDYWADARDQRRLGHMFNAAMLYKAADGLASKGPNFQPGILREIEGDAKNLSVPPELKGAPPYLWKFGANSYRVLQVIPFFAGGETTLAVKVEVPSVGDNKATDESNHVLIRHLIDAYPEIFRFISSDHRRSCGAWLWRRAKLSNCPVWPQRPSKFGWAVGLTPCFSLVRPSWLACRAVARAASARLRPAGFGAAAFASLRERRLVGGTGIEPVTPSMSRKCSSAELTARSSAKGPDLLGKTGKAAVQGRPSPDRAGARFNCAMPARSSPRGPAPRL